MKRKSLQIFTNEISPLYFFQRRWNRLTPLSIRSRSDDLRYMSAMIVFHDRLDSPCDDCTSDNRWLHATHALLGRFYVPHYELGTHCNPCFLSPSKRIVLYTIRVHNSLSSWSFFERTQRDSRTCRLDLNILLFPYMLSHQPLSRLPSLICGLHAIRYGFPCSCNTIGYPGAD